MKHGLELVLFDCDGTLTNSLHGAMDSFLHGFSAVGAQEIRPEEIIAWYGISADKIFQRLLPHRPDHAVAGFEAFLEHQRSQIQSVTLHAGMAEILQSIDAAGIPMGVVTGRHRSDLHIMFEHFGLHPYFDVIVTDDQVSKPKPSPEGLLKALQHGAWQAEKSVYIGDSASDILAAKAINMSAIAVCWDDHADVDALRRAEPSVMVSSASELRHVLVELGVLSGSN